MAFSNTFLAKTCYGLPCYNLYAPSCFQGSQTSTAKCSSGPSPDFEERPQLSW